MVSDVDDLLILPTDIKVCLLRKILTSQFQWRALVHTVQKRATCMLTCSVFYPLLQVSRLSKCKSSCDQVVIREKLKMTCLPVMLVKGSLIEESTCMRKAIYILALQVFLVLERNRHSLFFVGT